MARKLRKHYDEAIYHVILRGNNRKNIFFNDQDYFCFCDYLQEVSSKYLCKIHLFCLMTNHVHLVIEVSQIPLSKIMQGLVASYTLKTNHRYHRCGHIFQGRYKAKLVQNDNYLLELCYYIHHNPKKAKIVEDIGYYPWSSHHAYIGKSNFPWVRTDEINALINALIGPLEFPYKQFINDENHSFATPKFFEIDEENNLIISDSINKKINASREIDLRNVKFEIIVDEVCKRFNISSEMLSSVSNHKKITTARVLIAYIAHYKADYLLRDIALKFGRNPGSFGKTFHRNLKILSDDKKLQQELKMLEKILSS